MFGDLEQRQIDRLWTLFEESALPMRVDVVAYDLIEAPALKAHIDLVHLPLFKGQARCLDGSCNPGSSSHANVQEAP